jgi:hypothetical protein
MISPSLRRSIQIGLLVDQQLVAVIPRDIAHINPGLSAVGTDSTRSRLHELFGIFGSIRVVGHSKGKQLVALRAFDPLVKSQQTGSHRPRRDHVAFGDERAKQQDRDEE